MKFKRESKYGLEGLVYLGRLPPGRVTSLKDIAAGEKLPQEFLAKIFPKLVHHGLVRAYRGARRGYALAKPPEQISLRAILEAVEGPNVVLQCFFWGNECDVENPCPVHCRWREVRRLINDVLEQTTLRDLIVRAQLTGEAASASEPIDFGRGRGSTG